MNKQEIDEWFKKAENWRIRTLSANDTNSIIPIEDLYQAFKARLAAECAIKLFPGEEG